MFLFLLPKIIPFNLGVDCISHCKLGGCGGMADAPDLGSGTVRCVGSSPIIRIERRYMNESERS